MNELRLCVTCRFFEFTTDEGADCDTCGYAAFMLLGCHHEKRHWRGGLGADAVDFYRGIRKAQWCSNYSELSAEEIAAM